MTPAAEHLRPLHFLVGSWVGHGQSDGSPVTARFEAALILGDTFVDARERLFTADGHLDHEDRTLYRWDHADQSLRVLHLQAPAWTAHHYVDAVDGGAVWRGGPGAARVELMADGPDAFTVRVTMPGATEPASLVRYTRSEAGSPSA